MNTNLTASIKEIKNKLTDEQIDINTLSIVYTAKKYSSTGEKIWRLKLANEELTKRHPYIITYDCLTCHKLSSVGLTQFFRKINSIEPEYCYLCRNTKEEKRVTHSLLMTNLYSGNYTPKEKSIKKTFKDLLLQSIEEFNKLEPIKQKTYNEKHLSIDEFNKIQPYIDSLCNGKIKGSQLKSLEFWPIFKCNNQMHFSSVFYDPNNDTIIKGNQPIIKCENCNILKRCKSIEQFKTAVRILCIECKLCRKIFKIRNIHNIINEQVIYQSKPEFRFVTWCNNNNILVKNGPYIAYTFNNKEHIYRIDFTLPVLQIHIEIKDNHIWHKQQVESGKWEAKMKAVDEYIHKSGEKYLLLFPSNLDVYINQILKINKNKI
jgi:hypothetical protein